MKPQSRQHSPSSLLHFFPECIPFPQSSIFFMMLLIFQGRLATWSTPLRLPFISSIPNGHVMSQPCAEKCEHTLRWGSAPVRRPWVSLPVEIKDGFSLLFYCPPPAQLCDVEFCSRLSSCWRDVICFLFSAVSFQSYNHEAPAQTNGPTSGYAWGID